MGWLGQIDGGGPLAHAALLVDDCDCLHGGKLLSFLILDTKKAEHNRSAFLDDFCL